MDKQENTIITQEFFDKYLSNSLESCQEKIKNSEENDKNKENDIFVLTKAVERLQTIINVLKKDNKMVKKTCNKES